MKEYIEREAALAFVCEDCSGQNGCNVPCVDYVRIKSLPAADVVEVRHGRWISRKNESKHQDWWSCSKCGGQFDYKWRYCPNCGSSMGKEDAE